MQALSLPDYRPDGRSLASKAASISLLINGGGLQIVKNFCAGAGLGLHVQKIEIKQGINPSRREGESWLKMVLTVADPVLVLGVSLNLCTTKFKPDKMPRLSTCPLQPA